MNDNGIKVLLVGCSTLDVGFFKQALRGGSEKQFTILDVSLLSDAIKHLNAVGSDIVLVDWPFLASEGDEAIADLMIKFPDIPFVVFAQPEDEKPVLDSMRLGIQDYLVKGQSDGEMISHVLKTSVARHRMLCDELCGLDAVADTAEPFHPKGTLEQESLRFHAPKPFEDMKKKYSHVLELALEARAFRGDHQITVHLKELADALGGSRATPRDLVDLHTAVLKEKTGRAPLSRVEATVLEGRWVLLQTMGYLAAYYRHSCLGNEQNKESIAGNSASDCRDRS